MRNSVYPIDLVEITTEKDEINQIVEKTRIKATSSTPNRDTVVILLFLSLFTSCLLLFHRNLLPVWKYERLVEGHA